MKPVTRAWLRTVQGSYTPVSRVTLCEPGQTGTNPAGDRLEVVDGTVHLDGAAALYTTATLTLPGDLWDQLTTAGLEVYVQSGIQYTDAAVELVGFGYLRVRMPTQPDAHRGGDITIQCEDRNTVLARADLLTPRVYPADTTYGAMVADLVVDVFPDATVEWDDDTDQLELGREVLVEQKRLDALLAAAQAAGKVARWDHRGVLTLRTPPALLAAPPMARLAAGRGGVLQAAAREISDLEVCNAFVVTGESFDDTPPVRGVAVDNHPDSPTRYSGPFGPAVRHLTNSLVRTDAQALGVAQMELSRRTGLAHTVRFTVSPRPELEPDDIVHIEHPGQVGRHAIAALDIPLVPGRQMIGSTRAQTLVQDGAR